MHVAVRAHRGSVLSLRGRQAGHTAASHPGTFAIGTSQEASDLPTGPGTMLPSFSLRKSPEKKPNVFLFPVSFLFQLRQCAPSELLKHPVEFTGEIPGLS